MSRAETTELKPFIKWVGGKRQILGTIQGMLPAAFGTYFEPFLGGGAVFFRLVSIGLVCRAVLNDSNPSLAVAYRMVRDNPESLIESLKSLKQAHCKDHFYSARERFNHAELSDLERAALLIYLNKTCYNGLYRVNRSGQFNVPFGTYKNPRIVKPEQILACSAALRGVDIRQGDFADVTADARRGDFVYLDPPYVPLTKTANFTSYGRESFLFDDQRRLAETFRALDARGAKVLLSNHATPELLDLYQGFNVTVVPARRVLNTNASRRANKVDEVLVRNY